MNGKYIRQQKGFTYLTVLIAVIVMGITLTGASRYWHLIMKQERETELLFRGDRIQRAIKSYVSGKTILTNPIKNINLYPKKFEELLKDPRFPQVRRHIRKIYTDPMTEDGQWNIILGKNGAIIGVVSKSKEKPLKTGNFPKEYEHFKEAKTYSDWKFVYKPDNEEKLKSQTAIPNS